MIGTGTSQYDGITKVAHTMCPVLQTFGLRNFDFIEIIKHKHKMSIMAYKLYHRQPDFCTQCSTLKTENLVSYHHTKCINIRSTRQKNLKYRNNIKKK